MLLNDRNRPRGSHRARARRRGVAAIEVVVVLLFLLVALQTLSQAMIATTRQRSINREGAIAADAARGMLEEMRSMPFEQVFALYNGDPADDPGGAGTAAGNRFAVEGLTVANGVADGMHGTILFPTPAGQPGFLSEDVDDDMLGMPRDLSGDLVVDGANHAGDYSILPVHIVIAWRGRVGTQRFELYSQLVDFL